MKLLGVWAAMASVGCGFDYSQLRHDGGQGGGGDVDGPSNGGNGGGGAGGGAGGGSSPDAALEAPQDAADAPVEAPAKVCAPACKPCFKCNASSLTCELDMASHWNFICDHAVFASSGVLWDSGPSSGPDPMCMLESPPGVRVAVNVPFADTYDATWSSSAGLLATASPLTAATLTRVDTWRLYILDCDGGASETCAPLGTTAKDHDSLSGAKGGPASYFYYGGTADLAHFTTGFFDSASAFPYGTARVKLVCAD